MTTIPFGLHKGKPLTAIPTEYLTWAARIAYEPLRHLIQEELLRRDHERVRDHYCRRGADAQPELRFVQTIVERGFRLCARELHPDVGGHHDDMVALNSAREWLQAQIEVLV